MENVEPWLENIGILKGIRGRILFSIYSKNNLKGVTYVLYF